MSKIKGWAFAELSLFGLDFLTADDLSVGVAQNGSDTARGSGGGVDFTIEIYSDAEQGLFLLVEQLSKHSSYLLWGVPLISELIIAWKCYLVKHFFHFFKIIFISMCANFRMRPG